MTEFIISIAMPIGLVAVCSITLTLALIAIGKVSV